MDRRSFLLRVGGAVIAIPAILHATACSGDDEPGGASPDSAPATSFTAMGTLSGHTHEIEIQCADLSSGGVTYTSTSTNGHTHDVTLSADQLADIAAGVTVTVNTTDLHPHEWIISKPSTACK